MSDRKIILALDVPQRARAIELSRELKNELAMVKVGLEPYVAHGPDLIRELKDTGVEVFLDLKLHDIPRTAAAATREAVKLGVKLLTVHAAGGREMIQAVAEAAEEKTNVIAVTMLTSLDDQAAKEIGFAHDVKESALTLGQLAINAGADGLVCSAHELASLAPTGGLRIVPGVRPTLGGLSDDQKRVATPRVAVEAGATWLVIGRPILQAPNPLEAAQALNQELELK